MRYSLPTDRIINQLTPHFWGGRRFILFLQSLVSPLKSLNEQFIIFTKEKMIEANMTSQILPFEWFLNYKFGKYLKDPKDRIWICENESKGVDIYHEFSPYGKPFTIWHNREEITPETPNQELPKEFYLIAEEKKLNRVSFIVAVSEITIPENEFVYMLSYVVDKYKIAGKTYLIKLDKKEIYPNFSPSV